MTNIFSAHSILVSMTSGLIFSQLTFKVNMIAASKFTSITRKRKPLTDSFVNMKTFVIE